MQVHIQVFQRDDHLRQTLEDAGWRLDCQQTDMILARHPQVDDEPAARQRLHQLGLLTSHSVRIDFSR